GVCAHGPRQRPELTTAVVRGLRCEDRDRGNRPVGARRRVPVLATPVRHTNGAAARPTNCRTREWKLSRLAAQTHPPRWERLPRCGVSVVALAGWRGQWPCIGIDPKPTCESRCCSVN